MRVCPQCQARYEDDVRKCPYDGRRPLTEEAVMEAMGDPMMGTTLGGRFTVTGRVGSGGMGTVYKAEQAPMNREIALKVLRRDLGRDPETVQRFHREALTLSQLKHPNTVTIFDFGQTEDGLLYLAMELLEGEMLSARLKRDGAMDVPLAIKAAAGVLRSLSEAHTRGIIHRDLKPDNIFLARVHGRPEEDEMVKVVDFGIAKIRDGERGIEPLQTQEGTVFGTPRYMSPEQAQGKTLDGRSDLYAVGVLLFHMLTGQPPFTDDDAVVVMAHHIKSIPPPVRQVIPGRPIPEALESLVARAMAKDPGARPQTAEAFLAELESTLDEARKLAETPHTPLSGQAAAPPARSRAPRVVMAGAGAIALGGLAAVIVAMGTPRGTTLEAPKPATQPVATQPAALTGGSVVAANGPGNAPAPAQELAPAPPTAPTAPPLPPPPDMVVAPTADVAANNGATADAASPRNARTERAGSSSSHSGHSSHHARGHNPFRRWND